MRRIKGIMMIALAGWLAVGMVPGSLPAYQGVLSVYAESNSLNKTEITISKGESFTLQVRGEYGTVTWGVDNKKIAAVSDEGVIHGVSAGETFVYAIVDGVRYPCSVTVETPKLNKTKLTARLGNTYQLSVSGTKRKVSYRSSDAGIVKVSSKGKMTFLKPGSATVTATIGSSRLSCKVNVSRPSLSVPDLASGQEGSVDLKGKTYKNISFESSAPAVLFVDEKGKLTAGKPGSAQITVRIADYEWKKKVEVTNSLPTAVRYGVYEGLNGQEAELAKKAHTIFSSVIEEGMTEIEKIAALHDYIVLNTAYDTTYTRYSIQDTLFDGTAVCQGYAETMKLFLDALGIENQLIYGTGAGISHVWNLICLDGDWYHMDVTWDDPLLDGKDMPGKVHYEYFMVPDAVMAKEHIWKRADYPKADGGKYGDFIKNKLEDEAKKEGLFARTEEELIDLMVQKTKPGRTELMVLYAGDNENLNAMLQRVVNALAGANIGKKTSISYSIAQVGEYIQFMFEVELL
ncbi:MAG: Ig-like domain-containing protein [Lachnospiraceae bacterium]|nr:Ig-like domain-containing protein [Lachnospiraceae bacterium]